MYYLREYSTAKIFLGALCASRRGDIVSDIYQPVISRTGSWTESIVREEIGLRIVNSLCDDAMAER